MVMGAFQEGFFSVFKPKPKLRVSEYAELYRILPRKGAAEPGAWRNSRTPYLVEVMDALSTSSRSREIVVCKGAQLGFTEAGLNWLEYLIDYVGGPILALQPTDDNASEWSKQRITPSFDLCPRIREKIKAAKNRSSGDTIMVKEFLDGDLFLSGVNSPNALAGKPIGNLYGDEVDRWPGNVGGEGDPIYLAKQRLSTYLLGKIFLTSTPTTLEASRIWPLYQDSDRRVYEVACPECNQHQEIKFDRLIWERGNHEDVRLACIHCGLLIAEGHKPKMLAGGKWRATNPGHWRIGFHISAIYSPWLSWSEVARQFEEAEGDPVKMQVFVNTILGLPWEEDSESIAEEFLKRRIEPYAAQVPMGVLVLTMAVDNQGDRLEYEVKGWGEGEESWGIEYGIIPGDPSVLESGDPENPSVWEQLDERRRRIFRHEDGAEIRISCTFIDSGGSYTDIVYQYTKARLKERVYSVKGNGQPGRPLLNKPIRGGKIKAWLYVLGVNKGKDLVFARLKIDRPGPGYCHFPDDENLGYDGRYYAGLISEKKRVVRKNGVKRVVWVLPNKARNEPFDISVYNTAAIRMLMLHSSWDRLRARRAKLTGRKPPPTTVWNTSERNDVSAPGVAKPEPTRRSASMRQATPGVQLIEV